MKKLVSVLLCIGLLFVFGLFALGSGDSDSETKDQGSGQAEAAQGSDDTLGDYQLEISSCRLATDYEGKKVVIVKYKFTNNSDDPTSFMVTFDDNVYQNGVGLNGAYVLSDSANYSSDNQMKNIQKGATLDVEVAYELNDTTTDIVVEVTELFSFDNTKITKTFSIN